RNFARLKAGRSIAARMAMMAITTSNSMSVKPPRLGLWVELDMFSITDFEKTYHLDWRLGIPTCGDGPRRAHLGLGQRVLLSRPRGRGDKLAPARSGLPFDLLEEPRPLDRCSCCVRGRARSVSGRGI